VTANVDQLHVKRIYLVNFSSGPGEGNHTVRCMHMHDDGKLTRPHPTDNEAVRLPGHQAGVWMKAETHALIKIC
jgi:hypothetical protein